MGTHKQVEWDGVGYESIADACRALDISYNKVGNMMRGGATFTEVMHRIMNKISDVQLILQHLSTESAISARHLWESIPGLQHRTVDSVQATLRDMAMRELVISEKDKRPMLYRLPDEDFNKISAEDQLRFHTAWAPLRSVNERFFQR